MPDGQRRTRRRFVVLTVLRWFPTGLAMPVMVLLMRERGLDLATVGALLAVYSVVTALLELPTGGLADVIGRRPVLVLSVAATLVGLVLLAAGRTTVVLGLALAVLGAARALDSGPLQAWYVDAVQRVDERADLRPGLARAGAAEAAGLGVGALVGGGLVAVSPLPAESGVWIALSTPLLVGAAVCLVHLAAVVWWVTEPPREPVAGLGGALGDLPRTVARGAALAVGRGPLRRVMAFTGALGVVLAGVELLAPNSVAQLLGGRSEAAGPYAVLVTIGFFGTAVGSAVAPWVARLARSSSRGLLVSSVAAAVALLGLAAPTLGAVATAFVAFYLLLGVGGPLLDALTHAAVSSGERATVLSVRSMVLQVGGIVASLGIGALAGATSLLVGVAALTLVLLLGSLSMVRMPPPAAGPADLEPTPPRAESTPA